MFRLQKDVYGVVYFMYDFGSAGLLNSENESEYDSDTSPLQATSHNIR